MKSLELLFSVAVEFDRQWGLVLALITDDRFPVKD
jgi:hypothetical protein